MAGRLISIRCPTAPCWCRTSRTARSIGSRTVGDMRAVLWRPMLLGLAAASISITVAITGVRAQSPPVAERIKQCGACHGEDGNSQMANLPSLAGQPEFFIINQLFL